MLLRLKMYRLLLKITTYFLPFLAFEIGWQFWAFFLTFVNRPILYPRQGHFTLVLFSSFVWAFMAEHYKVTNVDELFRERTGAKAAWAAGLATALVLIGALYFARNDVFPRVLLVCSIIALLTLSILLHAAFRFTYRQKLRLGHPTRLLIVVADQFARSAATRLRRLSFAPCQVVAHVRLPGQEIAVEGTRIYELEELTDLHSGNGIDEVVMAIHPAQFSQIPGVITALEKLSVPSRAIVDLGEGVVVREKLFQVGRMQMLDLTTTPADSLDYALLKRAFDICFSTIVLLLSAPLMALIGVLVKITSPGPMLFAQERVGLNGQPFKMYKFRTMQTGSVTESDTRWTAEGDPRRTTLGT